jgi:hypothetical protein
VGGGAGQRHFKDTRSQVSQRDGCREVISSGKLRKSRMAPGLVLAICFVGKGKRKHQPDRNQNQRTPGLGADRSRGSKGSTAQARACHRGGWHPLGLSPSLAVYHPKHLLISIKNARCTCPHSRRGFQVGPEAQARHDTVSPLAADWLTTPSESVH